MSENSHPLSSVNDANGQAKSPASMRNRPETPRLRVAVVGAGHLGRIHCKLLNLRQDVELVGIVEPIAAAREAASREFWAPGVSDFRALPRTIDAAIVATPTAQHHAIALQLLRHDIHVFVEKPLTRTVEEADELVDVAARRQRVLQVGHVERFNPALDAVRPHLGTPRYLEAVRTSNYTGRSTDIGVVLDLMIHDLDIILSLVREPVVEVAAFGCTVVGPHEDMAQARLQFANGSVANVTASRVSPQAQRSLQIYSDGAMASLDFGACAARIARPSDALLNGQFNVAQLDPTARLTLKDRFFTEILPTEELSVGKRNAIEDEQADFVQAIRDRRAPRVSGIDARRALDIAERILAQFASPARHLPLAAPSTNLRIPTTRLPIESQPLRKAG
ncbi:MAG: Gfo/Idh/MocA family oxidoreductase [Pirellulales bacterium]